MRLVAVEPHVHLEDYEAVAHLVAEVRELRVEASAVVERLAGRTVWMLSSTVQGGGVAEMMPRGISLLRELGVSAEWAIIETSRPEFFCLTKRLHNMLHGEPSGELDAGARELYDSVSKENAEALLRHVGPRDIVVAHDPQPLGVGAMLGERLGVPAIFRCHIGLDEDLPATIAAWSFLRPYAAVMRHAIFSAPEYIPSFLAGRASVIAPAIDPLSHKNRELSLHKLVGVLSDSALVQPHWPLVHLPFEQQARRLQEDGSFALATRPDDIGLLCRPIVTQVSRWDRLKGWLPLLEAFRLLKLGRFAERAERDALHRRRLHAVRMVLAAADPSGVADDPEGQSVIDVLRERYLRLEPSVRRDVAIINLPLASLKQNALMVNALQRSASIVVQNSLREGFGLTVSEAMWKRAPILGNWRAVGIRQQVRDGQEGRLVDDPEDAEALGRVMDEMLADAHKRELWGRNAQRRVHDGFLIFRQLRSWLRLLGETAVLK